MVYIITTLKANLAVNGIKQMTEFCQNNDIDHDICGKVVVASNLLRKKF